MLSIFKSVPTHMDGGIKERIQSDDYKGQQLAEQIFHGIMLVSAIIGFIYGMIIQQFGWTVYILLIGFVGSCLLTLPPWPIYRKNPLKWLPAPPESSSDAREKAPESHKKPRKHK